MPECAATHVLRRLRNRLRSSCVFPHGDLWVYHWVYQCVSRLAPIKTLTVPRLELQTAEMASRLKSKIFEEIDLEINETHFWSDSKIVVHYLSTAQRRFSTFVSHRVSKIVSRLDSKEWHHIPGKMNVAEDCTRGKEIQELTPQCRWITGPAFLMLPDGAMGEVLVLDKSMSAVRLVDDI